jgi:hypothetical protein
MHSTKFPFIWPSGFRGEDILKMNRNLVVSTYMEGSVLSFLKG